MKTTLKSIITISIFAVLSVSCSTRLDVKDLIGFWQGECGRGFQFTDKGTYFFYFIENGAWKCSGDSENNFSVDGNEIRCEWTENGETKAISYFVDSFSRRKMILRSESGDISDGKYIKVPEPCHIDVGERKSALASSTLEQIDSLYSLYQKAVAQSFNFAKFELTEKEKLVKPEYLLDPSASNDFVTRSQKINALAIYVVEMALRELYDMPIEETKEVIAKIALDLNYIVDTELLTNDDLPLSEKIRKEYEIFKENDALALFWQFQNAVVIEAGYFFAQNPDLFFSKITEEQWQAFIMRVKEKNMVMSELAKYDEEMAGVLQMYNQTRVVPSDEEMSRISSSIESEKQFRIANKNKFVAQRNALIQ